MLCPKILLLVPHCYFSQWLLPSVSQIMTNIVQIAPFSGIFIPIQATPESWTPALLVIPHLQGSAFSPTVSMLDASCYPYSHGPSRCSAFTKDCFWWVCPLEVLSTHTGFFTAKQLCNAELTVAKTARESWVLWCGVLKCCNKSAGFSLSPSEFRCQKLHQRSSQPVYGLI